MTNHPRKYVWLATAMSFSLFMATAVGFDGMNANAQQEAPVPAAQVADAITYQVPASVKQGEVLRIRVKDAGPEWEQGAAWLAGNSGRFFKRGEGEYEALVSTSVFQKPGGYTIKLQDKSGATRHTAKVEMIDAKYRVQNIRRTSQMAGLQPLPGEMEAIEALKTTVTPVRYWDEAFVAPTTDCENSPFGVKRAYNGVLSDNYHRGVDNLSPAGRPIKATNNGKVQIAKMYRMHGGTVGLDHGQGMSSIYIHMSKLNVKEGQEVKKGDVIGYVGSTGFATGPHLHWGLYVSGMPVNPNQFVKGVPRC